MRTATLVVLLASVLVLIPTRPGHAALVEFDGFSFETGGFPDSNPGDILEFVAVIDLLAAPLTWTPVTNQYTLSAGALISLGQQPVDPQNIEIEYTGGTLHIFEDDIVAGTPADPGTNPPNPTAPSTYRDGVDYLIGAITEFQITYNTTFESGAFEGEVLLLGGSHVEELGTDARLFTFGGVFSNGTPSGYDLTWNGFIILDGVPVESETWGGIKSQFRDAASD